MFLHAVQCCYILPRVITSCAVLFDVTKSYYMMCSVVTCYLGLLHAVQYCYIRIVLLNFVQQSCCDVFLSAVQYFHMLHCVVEFCATCYML